MHQEPYRFDETPVTLTFASCNFKEQQVPIECSGEWEISDQRKEYLFSVQNCSEQIPTDAQGILKYLKTLDGIGPKSAKKLFSGFLKGIFAKAA